MKYQLEVQLIFEWNTNGNQLEIPVEISIRYQLNPLKISWNYNEILFEIPMKSNSNLNDIAKEIIGNPVEIQ